MREKKNKNDNVNDVNGKRDNKKAAGKFKNWTTALSMELREHKSSAIVYFTLRALVIIMLVLQLLNRNYENVFLCILTLLLLVIPSLAQITFKVELPTALEIIILVFIFSAEILGEISEFYLVFPFWDTVLHTLNGFLAAAIGFSLVDLLNRSDRTVFSLSPLFTAIVAFCFSMTIGVVWEFFEFGMDMIMELDMQKDTVIHTIRSVMLDPGGHNVPYAIQNITDVAIVNFIGAAVFSVLGFFYVKSRGKGKVAGSFIPRRKAHDRDFLRIARESSEVEQDIQEKSQKVPKGSAKNGDR